MPKGTVIKLDPLHPTRIPTATSDVQVQGMIDLAIKAERERCIRVVQVELAKWESKHGVGWTWDKVRTNILTALNALRS